MCVCEYVCLSVSCRLDRVGARASLLEGRDGTGLTTTRRFSPATHARRRATDCLPLGKSETKTTHSKKRVTPRKQKFRSISPSLFSASLLTPLSLFLSGAASYERRYARSPPTDDSGKKYIPAVTKVINKNSAPGIFQTRTRCGVLPPLAPL